MPFRLDLFRHGDAVAAGPDGDAARALSPMGRRDVERVAEEYARLEWRPDRIYASPLRRAQETASILLARIGDGREPETLRELVPDHTPAELLFALTARETAEYVLAIGHQPLLSQLAAMLCAGREPRFPPGGVTRIEFDGDFAAGMGRIVSRVWPEELP